MILSTILLALWIVLQQSLAPSDILLGVVIAAAATWAYSRLRVPAPRPRLRLRPLLALALTFAGDVVRSNVAVARIVLGLRRGKRSAGFLALPLALRDPRGLAILGCIITATPGTSWARYDARRNEITIHVLDLVDADAWVRDFKSRYETRLLEIFE